MPGERFDEKLQAQNLEVFSESPTGSQNHYPAGAHLASNTPINSAKGHQPPSQFQAGLPIPSSLLTTGSPEPYVSVGCLKCGASDHVATNRNCPRPRKAAPVTNLIPAQAQVVKKNSIRSPKRPSAEHHHLKEAKMGDDTKFWYYISDDSEEGEQGDPGTGKRIRIEMDQTQGSTATHGGYHDPADGGFRNLIEGSTQLDLSPRHVINRSSMKLRDRAVKTTQDYNKAVQTIMYGTPIEGTGVGDLATPQGARMHDEDGLGSIPSLPWKVSATSPLSPVKHLILSPGNDAKMARAPRKRKIVPKPPVVEERKEPKGLDASPQRQLRKGAKASPVVPSRSPIGRSQQITKSIIEATHGTVHSPRPSRKPGPAKPSPARSPRYPPRHANRTSAQSIEDSFMAEKAEIMKFNYNYMGSSNTVQPPRVQYAPDRVQGWRECRSMGTGLE